MTDITVLPDSVSLTSYVTYYGIYAVSNCYITLQYTPTTLYVLKSISVEISSGSVFVPLPTASIFSYLRSITIAVYSNPNQGGLITPLLTNSRVGLDVVNINQVLPVRFQNTQESTQIINSYIEAGQSLDGMTEAGRKIIANNIGKSVKSRRDFKVMLSSLVGNYGKKK